MERAPGAHNALLLALEEQLGKYPFQWFMYRDIWKDAADHTDA